GALGELSQELDEAPDVRVVERGLDLVQKVEGARAREEEREEERDRPERLLAAREKREARDALARRLQLDLDPGLLAFPLRLAAYEPALAAREEGARDLREVALDGGVGPLEATLDGPGQVVSELGELLERPFEILPLHGQLLEALLLAGVFLGSERV